MSNDHAMTRTELAARIGVNPNWITANVPKHWFVGNRIHWNEYLRCREEQRRLATPEHARQEPSAPVTESDHRWQEVLRRFGGQSSSNGRRGASHAPVVCPPDGSESQL